LQGRVGRDALTLVVLSQPEKTHALAIAGPLQHGNYPSEISKIDRPAVDLPIAEAGGVGTAAAADFGGKFGLCLSFLRLAAFLSFGERSLGSGRERLARDFTGFGVEFIVVIGCLHDLIGPEPLN